MPINIDGFSSGVAVNIGNPHIVFFGNNIHKIDLSSIGPSIENNELFPKKTNVEIIEILNESKIRMRVWERGAGITQACGSGACAAVYAGKLKELLKDKVEVEFEKGSLLINIENNNAIMTGPAEISFCGKMEI
jgi:diaminopimelate epimerase